MSDGWLDSVAENVARGWAALSKTADIAATVQILVDKQCIGEVIADRFRDDLLSDNIRDGFAAFSFPIPARFFDGRQHQIEAVIRETGKLLQNSPLKFRATPREMPLVREKVGWSERELLLRKSHRSRLFPGAVRKLKKVAVLSTFHSASKFLGYHYTLIRNLANAGFVVLVMHATGTSDLPTDDIDRDNCFLYVKRNLGYDFGSWAAGVFLLSDLLHRVEEMVLVNDSVLGLQADLTAILDQMRTTGADMVSLTDSYERDYHLQSYFLWMGPKVCRSSLLQLFMANYSFGSDKQVAIKEGEIGISRFFLEHGFTVQALHAYQDVAGTWLKKVPHLARAIENLPNFDLGHIGSNSGMERSYRGKMLEKLELIVSHILGGVPMNPTHFFWDTLVADFGHPFLKRELLLVNPGEVPTYFQLSKADKFATIGNAKRCI